MAHNGQDEMGRAIVEAAILNKSEFCELEISAQLGRHPSEVYRALAQSKQFEQIRTFWWRAI